MSAAQTLTPNRTVTRARPEPMETAAALPRGAYVPFGEGSRMCLGKRFGEYELRALAAVLLRRIRLEPLARRDPRIVTTPTLGPKGGLRFAVRTR